MAEKIKKHKQEMLDKPAPFTTLEEARRIAQSPEVIFRNISKNWQTKLKAEETAAANEGTHTVSNNNPVVQLADAATKEAYYSVMMPQDLKPVSMKFIWTTSATSGNLYCQVDISEGGEGEANNARTTGGTAFATATNGTANAYNYTELINKGGIVLSDIKKGNNWGIKFSRLGGNANDTLSAAVNLYGILIKFK